MGVSLKSLKPAAPARVHLLLAAVVWTAVGGTMAVVGLRWTLAGQAPYLTLFLVLAVVVGLLKSRYMLDRAAARIVQRIEERGDGRCLGGFLAPRAWLLLLVMVGMGRLLRGSEFLPRPITGLIFVAVGTALSLSACGFWRAWRRHVRQRSAMDADGDNPGSQD